MAPTAADFQPFIDWYRSSGPIWKHHVVFDLSRVDPVQNTDPRVHYQGEFVYVPSLWVDRPPDYKGFTLVPGNLHGTGSLFGPTPIWYPTTPSVIVVISLKPVTIGIFFVSGEPDIADKLFESISVSWADVSPGDFVLGFFLPQQELEYRLYLTTTETSTLDLSHRHATVPSLKK